MSQAVIPEWVTPEHGRVVELHHLVHPMARCMCASPTARLMWTAYTDTHTGEAAVVLTNAVQAGAALATVQTLADAPAAPSAPPAPAPAGLLHAVAAPAGG